MALNLIDLINADFRTSRSADEKNTQFQRLLGLRSRYGPARLAIGRSLSRGDQPDIGVLREGPPGKAIKGESLFGRGSDLATWAALVVEHSDEEVSDRKHLQELVGAHWHRGMSMLWDDWKRCDKDFDKFLIRIMERAGLEGDGETIKVNDEEGPTKQSSPEFEPKAVPINLKLGDPSTNARTDEPVSWGMNSRGVSPHIAIMGTLGTGKTRIGMDMLRHIREESNCPLLLFDMGKGDLAGDENLVSDLGAQVISVPKQPVPLDVLHVGDRSENSIKDATFRFRDSFSAAAPRKFGGKQLDALREAIQLTLRIDAPISINDVKNSLFDVYEEKEMKEDTVTAQFNDFCTYTLFSQGMSPSEFLQKNWIIDVHEAADTIQRLVVFLMLDAVDSYLRSLGDSELDAENNRALRLIVVVDEARKVLGYKHPSLVNIIRTARSKGGAVMLISQSPDDFDQEDENFLENIGLPIVFRTNAKPRALKSVLGQNVDLGAIPNGQCVTRLPDESGKVKLTHVKVWE